MGCIDSRRTEEKIKLIKQVITNSLDEEILPATGAVPVRILNTSIGIIHTIDPGEMWFRLTIDSYGDFETSTMKTINKAIVRYHPQSWKEILIYDQGEGYVAVDIKCINVSVQIER
jgi:hypothetical protein